MKRWLLLTLVLGGCAHARTLPTPVAVRQGPFEADVHLVGTVQPLDTHPIALAQGLWDSNVETLAPEGQIVKKGDLVARVASRHVVESLLDRKDELATERASMAQARANAPVKRYEVDQAIVDARRAWHEKTLAETTVARGGAPDVLAGAHRDVRFSELALADDQLAAKEDLYDKGVIGHQALEEARRDHDIAVLNRRSALLALDQLGPGAKHDDVERARLEADMARASYHRAKVDAPAKRELIGLETDKSRVRVRGLTREVRNLASKLDATNLYAPTDGMVLYPLIWGWKKVHVGLQVWPGLVFLNVARLDALEITTAVSEDEIAKVHAGERAELSFDGYPGRVFAAHVTQVSKLAKEEDGGGRSGRPTSPVKRFDVKLHPDLAAPELKPNMRVQVRIVSDAMPQASAVPQEALFGPEDARFVWLAGPDGPHKQPVTPKLWGADWVALASPLPAGSRVYLLDPTQTLADAPAQDAP